MPLHYQPGLVHYIGSVPCTGLGLGMATGVVGVLGKAPMDDRMINGDTIFGLAAVTLALDMGVVTMGLLLWRAR